MLPQSGVGTCSLEAYDEEGQLDRLQIFVEKDTFSLASSTIAVDTDARNGTQVCRT